MQGGSISIDYIELPKARSGRDFMEVHTDLLTGRVQMVPTFKSATVTAAVPEAKFRDSVVRSLGLPD